MKKKASSTKATQPRTSQLPDTKKSGKKEAVNAQDIISLILKDHKPLKELIETLKDGDLERTDKEGSFEKFVPLLKGHATAEEKSLYVEMKDTSDLRVEGFEGDTEHSIADQLVQEINATPDDDEWNAKVKVLAELVEHHIQEEEEEMLPEVKKEIDEATRLELGAEYLRLKTEFDSLNTRPAKKQDRISEHRAN